MKKVLYADIPTQDFTKKRFLSEIRSHLATKHDSLCFNDKEHKAATDTRYKTHSTHFEFPPHPSS